jgi:hypothetical protein
MIKSAIIGMWRMGATHAEISEVTGLYASVVTDIITKYKQLLLCEN